MDESSRFLNGVLEEVKKKFTRPLGDPGKWVCSLFPKYKNNGRIFT
jgi:hypothetical protein